MRILVIGNSLNLDELKLKFGSENSYTLAETEIDTKKALREAEIVFDFIPSKRMISSYSEFNKPVFLSTSFVALSELINPSPAENHDFIFGFCGLPTFVNRPVLEVTIASKNSYEKLKSICAQLKTDFVCVEDRVGLVTPRVICMIINEAYITCEEGIATREDIDLAMKLGTNYPFGPFEWAERIGIPQVINLLDAMYRATGDTRYKVCALLRSELKN